MTISDEKKKFIDEFIAAQEGASQKQIIKIIIEFQKVAQKKNISFSKDEITYLYEQISKDLSNEERSKALKIINML
ncbi:MAG: hypothetical protein U0K68_05075 [Agathobacter sp.]|nr:hypothetical protein [Agathobacter sp.]